MSRIFKTKVFMRWADKYNVSDAILVQAVQEMESGMITADLGGSVFKQRIPLPGQGKRGGARTIIAARLNERYFFLYGFAKNEQDNISKQELRLLQEAGQELLGLDSKTLRESIDKHKIKEIKQ